ncbi:hypothetical protein BN961_03856 [Afipia felis]|uniref:Peptidase C39-like domain-containing protein n=2 Tax=Afipia felis TaxID=1035 RepID=A0A090MSZ0_AFIFE|nr:hypothetical protein BN961_03856 [Afipia felis]
MSPDDNEIVYSKVNDLPPRQQWEANYGYCGEVSFISAGLYYGQYVSQYDARKIASENADQSTEGSQLLLGENDAYTAAKMHLKAVQWKGGARTTNFLSWAKKNIASGYPVIIGVFKNALSFEESSDPHAGDDKYDHIVLATGVSSRHPLESSDYYNDDEITFSDHGLWSPDDDPQYTFTSQFGSLRANRRLANSDSHPVYALPEGVENYGVAITGIIDQDGQALPVRLSTNLNSEEPSMVEGSDARPASQNLTLTVTVSGLVPGLSYNLYRYDDFQSVPNGAFNATSDEASKTWKIVVKSGSSFTLKETIESDQIAVYRAVPATAP